MSLIKTASLFVALGVLSSATWSQAATRTWSGGVSNDWFVDANWVEGAVPTSLDDVVIDGGYFTAPSVDLSTAAATVASLSMGMTTTAELTVKGGGLPGPALRVEGDVLVGDYGILTHPHATDVSNGILNLDVGGNLSITGFGSIDVSGRGWPGGTSQLPGLGLGGGDGGDAIGGGGGAGHGGYGGHSLPSSAGRLGGPGYGSITNPARLGSGGGGGSTAMAVGGNGGGAIKLNVGGDLFLDGRIRADGNEAGNGIPMGDGGGGSGGSVWIHLTGSFYTAYEPWDNVVLVSADGGSATQQGGGGGGGRVSLVSDFPLFSLPTVSARGGPGGGSGADNGGGAGTNASMDTFAPYANVILDNFGLYGRSTLMHETVTIGLVTTRGAVLGVAGGTTTTVMGSPDPGTSPWLVETEVGGHFYAPHVTEVRLGRFVNRGVISMPSAGRWFLASMTNYGIYNHGSSSLNIARGTTWIEAGSSDTIGVSPAITDLVVDGHLTFANQSPTAAASFNSLTVESNGVVDHSANNETAASSLNLQLGTLTVEAGGTLDVSGLGFPGGAPDTDGFGPGGGSSLQPTGAGGGAHGGDGGGALAELSAEIGGSAYGMLTEATTLGSGGGGSEGTGGNGGGAIKVTVTDTFLLDGTLRADGTSAAPSIEGGGGAGGTLWLDVGTLAGAGALSAAGGLPGSLSGLSGGGGGGRIVLTYDTLTYSGSMDAPGGAGVAMDSGLTSGGAGTIFLRERNQTWGELIIDNGGVLGHTTPILSDETVQSLTVAHGGLLLVGDGISFTLLDDSVTASGFSRIEIEASGQWSAESLIGLEGVELTNRSTLNFPAMDTWSAGTMINRGAYNHLGPTLVIAAGAVWNEAGLFSSIGDVQPITDLVVEGTLEFWNQSASETAFFNTLTVAPGGRVSHDINGEVESSTLHLELFRLTIQSGGAIDANGRGHAGGAAVSPGFGPGASDGNDEGAGGASHAGYGGEGEGAVPGSAGADLYGDRLLPTALGSGGGGSTAGNGGRAGGGSVNITVYEQAIVDGSISADGMPLGFSSAPSGAGSGGSILLSAGNLMGTGVISAAGGFGGNDMDWQGGAGGGGRIAIYPGINQFGGEVSAAGGQSWSTTADAQDGTVYIDEAALAPPSPTQLGPPSRVTAEYTTETAPTLTFDLRGAATRHALRYTLQVDDSADFSSPVVEYVSAFLVPAPLSFTVGQEAQEGAYVVGAAGQHLESAPYYWRVWAENFQGQLSAISSANGGLQAFIVNVPPTVVILTPQDATVHQSLGSIFGSAEDPDGTVAAVEITLFSADAAEFYDGVSFASDTPVWVSTRSGNTFEQWIFETHGLLVDEAQYAVQARVQDSAGQIVVGPPVAFSTSAAGVCPRPQDCYTLEIESGNGQSGIVGTALDLPLAVRVVDLDGNSASGVQIDWKPVLSNGSVMPGTCVSDAAGRCTGIAVLGTQVGVSSDLYSVSLTGNPIGARYFSASAFVEKPAAVSGIAAVFSVSPDAPVTPAVLSFDGSASTPSAGANILSYSWELGDGRAFNGDNDRLNDILYEVPATYGVALEVIDSFGERASSKQYVTISDGHKDPPVGRILWQPLESDALTVSFSCDCSDSDGEIVAVTWEYGDGDMTNLNDQHHTYAESGSYVVRLTLEDDSGLRAFDQEVVTVVAGTSIPPVARIRTTTLEGPAPLRVSFTADVHDEDGSVMSMAWDFANETVEDAPLVTRIFEQPGYHVVQLNAWDNDGLGAHDQVTITVRKGDLRPPRIVSTGGTTVTVGVPYRYDADMRPSAQGSRPLLWRLAATEQGTSAGQESSISIDAGTGAITWTPTVEELGEHLLRLEVLNEAGRDLEDLRVEVVAPEESVIDDVSAVNDGCNCQQTGGRSLLWLACIFAVWRRRS